MLTIIEFDFERKTETEVTMERAREAMKQNRFVWLDLDTTDLEASAKVLDELAILPPGLKEDVLSTEPATRFHRFDDYLEMVMSACEWIEGHLQLSRIDVIVGKCFLLTAHDGPVRFLGEVRKHYRADFLNFARSPSFLIFEIWDHLVEDYRVIHNEIEHAVEKLQEELAGDVHEGTFENVSKLGGEILRFRNVLLPIRSVLTDLGTRKSAFVSEATQPFLAALVSTIERLLADLMVDREILTDRLNLNMLLVSHRTNQVMHRLTIVSIFFLPLTFLCGIYGMNFEFMPELHWKFGYLWFYGLTAAIAVGLYLVMRRFKLL